MTAVMAYDFNSLCRICLRKEEDMIHLFYTPPCHDAASLYNQIAACCQIEIYPDDGFPQQICGKCYGQLRIAYDLRQLCLISDDTLKKYVDAKEPRDTVVVKMGTNDAANSTEPTAREAVVEEEPNLTEATFTSKPSSKRPGRKKTQKILNKEYSCTQCNKSFVYKCHLDTHLVSHSGDKPFLCSSCGKSFAHHTSLINHMKLHDDDAKKKYKCDRCPQSFHRRTHLVLHHRTHTGEKPFVCKSCGRQFAQSSYLKEHVRVHSGEKPFICETCGRGFARKSCLVMHRRTHTGELPYACPACHRAFSQRSQRKRHVLRNHKNTVALRENGELSLKEHDQLHAVLLSTLKGVSE